MTVKGIDKSEVEQLERFLPFPFDSGNIITIMLVATIRKVSISSETLMTAGSGRLTQTLRNCLGMTD